MKKFHFSLRAVGVLRAHREMQAKQALASAQAVLQAAEASLAAARGRVEQLQRAIALAREGGFRADQQVSFLQDYRRQMAAEAEAVRQVETAKAELARRRQACVEAFRQRKIVSRLEERAREAHRLATLQAEQIEIDERAGFAAAARTKAS